MEELGVIYGKVSTKGFKFLATHTVGAGTYCEVKREEGPVLCLVNDVTRKSEISFDKAREIPKDMPVEDKLNLSASASIVGYRDKRNFLQRPRKPFNAGQKVYRASDDLIKKVLGLSGEGGYIGKLRWHGVKVKVDSKELLKRHVSILAKTGSGKSYLTGVLIEEMLEKNLPVVIIDPHREYTSLTHPNIEEDINVLREFDVKPKAYATTEYSPDIHTNPGSLPLRFRTTDLDIDDICDLARVTSSIELAELRKCMRRRYRGLRDLREKIPRKSLRSKLESLEALGLFVDDGLRIKNLVKEGEASIINLRGVEPRTQELVARILAKKLFELRKLGRIPSLMLVVEEAHSFCPQAREALSSGVLRTIASEGRKFSLGLCVVSQRPAVIDKNILSQCAVQTILKMTNPNDLKSVIASFEGLTSASAEEIQNLPVGVCMFVGGKVPMPILVNVRPRRTKHGFIGYKKKRKRGFIEKFLDEIR